jgi:hypothetical protein
MTGVEESATVPTPRLGKQMASNDHAAANEEEVEDQIEEENVGRAACENRSATRTLTPVTSRQKTADHAVVSREEVQ